MKFTEKNMDISRRSVERLILYRKLLIRYEESGEAHIFSHKLAELADRTAAQVRRDLMAVGFPGSPVNGYQVKGLIKALSNFLDDPVGQNAALIGIGNLGRAVLEYCWKRHPKLKIVVAFDNNPSKVAVNIHDCECYDISALEENIVSHNIKVAILAIPATAAFSISQKLLKSGIKAILNFTPARLPIPDNVYIENFDIMRSLEKAAYFARKLDSKK
ncbi:MAG: rex [Ignavibacteria bacterium]|nr:rex [Ignavibacteria bacterium]